MTGMRLVCWLGLVGVLMLLTGCVSDTARAPVVNGWHQPDAASESYVVRSGDTLYSVAWAFGLDYRSLAEENHLQPPYAIKIGQRLAMTSKPRGSGSESDNSVGARSRSAVASPRSQSSQVVISHWEWPTRGALGSRFSLSADGYQGIEIMGQLGQPVNAAVSGEVVYSGSGVKGYGNLIIIKHNENYLSAYAFNEKCLVALGQKVQAGQKIASMGRNNAGKTLLYFEIRKDGKPVDPLKYLG